MTIKFVNIYLKDILPYIVLFEQKKKIPEILRKTFKQSSQIKE